MKASNRSAPGMMDAPSSTNTSEVAHDLEEDANSGLFTAPPAARTFSETATLSSEDASPSGSGMARPNSACPRYHAFAATAGAIASGMSTSAAASQREGQGGAAAVAGSAGTRGWQPTPSAARAASSALMGGLRCTMDEGWGGQVHDGQGVGGAGAQKGSDG